MAKTAVIVFNLGGPDCPEAVEPFLFNLFSDPAIIGVPNPLRWLLAKLISRKRAPLAREIYAHIGGKSPLMEQTEAQARALEARLGPDFRVFPAMRYWHPFTEQAAAEAVEWGAEQVVLLPLYPQFSTTTTRSSLRRWKKVVAEKRIRLSTSAICCYPVLSGFVEATAELVRAGWQQARDAGTPRVLFSAHGLPKRVVEKGDPYQRQVEQSARAVADAVGIDGLDWTVCYQSRVGPLEWIGPSTEEELERAGRDKVPVVVVPIAFVSEHSETLVELDLEYRHKAQEWGVPAYVRVPTVGTHPAFIAGLADLVVGKVRTAGIACRAGGFSCCLGEERA